MIATRILKIELEINVGTPHLEIDILLLHRVNFGVKGALTSIISAIM